jgi:hypothetical protein
VVLALVVVALLVAVSGCSSGDPTASTEVDPEAVPDDVANLVAEWKQAMDRGDGSVIDLYTPNGYHLSETQKITGEDLVSHLESSSELHPELTELLLLVDEPYRYVVTQGVRITVPSITEASAIILEIVVTADGLKIAQSAWFGSAR